MTDKRTKPTPAELLAQSRALHEALKDFDSSELTSEAVAIVSTPEFQGTVASIDALVQVLPEGRFRSTLANIPTAARAVVLVYNQEKAMAERAEASPTA